MLALIAEDTSLAQAPSTCSSRRQLIDAFCLVRLLFACFCASCSAQRARQECPCSCCVAISLPRIACHLQLAEREENLLAAHGDQRLNRGTLVPGKTEGTGTLTPGMVPARCGPDQFLLIGPPPEMGDYVLPGNNYHVYDIPLFWANLRANVADRVAAWRAAVGAKP